MKIAAFKYYVLAGVAALFIFHFYGLGFAEDQGSAKSAEKQIVIKGLGIGMDVNDARKRVIDLLGDDFTVTPIGRPYDLLQEYIYIDGKNDETVFFGYNRMLRPRSIDKKGFFIKKKNSPCSGFISADVKDDKVTRISLNGKTIDFLYSTSGIIAEDFVTQFESNFGLPELPWIVQGWSYASPKGYVITIINDKLIDIKKSEPQESKNPPKVEEPQKPEETPNTPKIAF